MRIKGLLVKGFLLFSISNAAFAVISIPNGWYLDGSLGYSQVEGDGDTQNGIGGSINFGYKFMPFFGAEIGLTQHASNYIRGPNNKKVATITNTVFDLASKGIVPIGLEGVELFAKLGFAKIESQVELNNKPLAASMGIGDNSESSCGPYLGVGIQYNWTPSIGLDIQWTRAVPNSGHISHLDLLSAGAIYVW